MRHNIVAEFAGVKIRPVRMEDASFIFQMRRHPKLAKFLGEFDNNYSVHLSWLQAYFQREEDYYFCIEKTMTQKRIGTIAIYNQNGQEAEWGRIIINPNYTAAPASVWLIYYVAFEKLGLARVYCRTVKDNRQVVSLHDHSGADRIAIENSGITIKDISYDMVVHQVTRAQWPQVKKRLEPAAQMALRFMEELN